jgi:hypothetical protein
MEVASPKGCRKLAGDNIPGKTLKQLMRPERAREILQFSAHKIEVVTNTCLSRQSLGEGGSRLGSGERNMFTTFHVASESISANLAYFYQIFIGSRELRKIPLIH